jgi:hypothetical protein
MSIVQQQTNQEQEPALKQTDVLRRYHENNIQHILIHQLGKSAYNNDMKVDNGIAGLCKAVRYLVTQIGFIADMEPEDAQSYVNEVLEKMANLITD